MSTTTGRISQSDGFVSLGWWVATPMGVLGVNRPFFFLDIKANVNQGGYHGVTMG